MSINKQHLTKINTKFLSIFCIIFFNKTTSAVVVYIFCAAGDLTNIHEMDAKDIRTTIFGAHKVWSFVEFVFTTLGTVENGA